MKVLSYVSVLVGCGLLLLNTIGVVEAASPFISYQAKLSDGDNVTVVDGSYNVAFILYDAPTNGTVVWNEIRILDDRVPVRNGLLSVSIGELNSLADIDFTQPLFLTVKIGGTGDTPVWDAEMSPRKPLTTAPAAFTAERLGTYTSDDFIKNKESNLIATSTSDALLSLLQEGSGAALAVINGIETALTITKQGFIGIGTTAPDANFEIVSTGDTYMAFSSSASSTTGDVFVVDNSGRVGIGDANPDTALSVMSDDAAVANIERKGVGASLSRFANSARQLFVGMRDDGDFVVTTSETEDDEPLFRIDSGTGDVSVAGAVTSGRWEGEVIASEYLDVSGLLSNGLSTESLLESVLQDVTNVFTNNDTIPLANIQSSVLDETEINTESKLEALLGNVTNIFTNNDTIPLANLDSAVVASSEINTESKLEALLGNVTNIFTNNDTIPLANISDSFVRNTGDTVSGNYNFGNGTLFVNSGNGRVGVGTAAPVARLSVEASGVTNGYFNLREATGRTNLFLDSNDNSMNSSSRFLTARSGTQERAALTGDGRMAVSAGSAATPSFTFMSDTNSGMFSAGSDQVAFAVAGSEQMRLLSGARLGLGTSDPNAALHIFRGAPNIRLTDANTGASGFVGADSNNGSLVLGADHDSTIAGSGIFMRVDNENVARFNEAGKLRLFTYGAGSLRTDDQGNVTVSSDDRLKVRDGNFTRGLDSVLAINPISYRWNELSGMATSSVYSGFSAQNVQAAIPEAVGTDSAGFLTLSDQTLLAAVVNAIKELWAMVTGMDTRLAALEAKIAALEGGQTGIAVSSGVIQSRVSTEVMASVEADTTPFVASTSPQVVIEEGDIDVNATPAELVVPADEEVVSVSSTEAVTEVVAVETDAEVEVLEVVEEPSVSEPEPEVIPAQVVEPAIE